MRSLSKDTLGKELNGIRRVVNKNKNEYLFKPNPSLLTNLDLQILFCGWLIFYLSHFIPYHLFHDLFSRSLTSKQLKFYFLENT